MVKKWNININLLNKLKQYQIIENEEIKMLPKQYPPQTLSLKFSENYQMIIKFSKHKSNFKVF